MYYTNQCARNLALFAQDATLNPRTGTVLTEIFSIVNFTQGQMDKIIARVNEVMQGLTDPTLTSPNSTRFVYGVTHVPENSFAFTLPKDIDKAIYLIENFFDLQLYPLGIQLNAPFDIDDHARAATLIHEVSHIVSATEDIAYLDTMRPFVDLMNVATSDYTLLRDLQSTSLSATTPHSELFTTWDAQSRNWVSLGAPGSTAAYNLVLRLTGTTTLNDARDTFLTNPDRRLDVILANADSVTYLITHVGRVLDPGA